MGGRPLAARLGATGRAFLLVALAVLLAPADEAGAQSHAFAAVGPATPATSDDDQLPDPAGLEIGEDIWVEPAAGSDAEPAPTPAAGPLTDPGRDPADEADIAATGPAAAEKPAEKPADEAGGGAGDAAK